MKGTLWLSFFAIAAAAIASAQNPRPMRVLLQVGQVPVGATEPVESINGCSINRNGKVAIAGKLQLASDTEYFMTYDGQVRYRNALLPGATGGDFGQTGISNSGDYVVSVSATGNDAVIVNGLLAGQPTDAPFVLVKNSDPAPADPGYFLKACSRVQMTSDGTVYWISTFAATVNGTTIGRQAYRKRPGQVIELLAKSYVPFSAVLADSTPVSITPGNIGIAFDYDVSDNGLFRAWSISEDAVSTTSAFSNDHLILNTLRIAKEGDPAGGSLGNYGSPSAPTGMFNFPVSNNSGAFACNIRTSAAGYGLYTNGSFKLIPGSNIGSTTLGVQSQRPTALNNRGWVGFTWGASVTTSTTYLGNADVPEGSRTVVAAGQRVDTDGDLVADATVNSLLGGITDGTNISVDQEGNVTMMANITRDGDVARNAVIQFPYRPGDVDFSMEVDAADIDLVIAAFGGTPSAPGWDPLADVDLSGEIDAADIDITIANFGS